MIESRNLMYSCFALIGMLMSHHAASAAELRSSERIQIAQEDFSVSGFAEMGVSPMTETEIRKLMIGNVLRVRKDNLVVGHEALKDGRLYIHLRSGKAKSKYWFEGDKYCLNSVRGGSTCVQFFRLNDRVLLCDERDGGYCDWEMIK